MEIISKDLFLKICNLPYYKAYNEAIIATADTLIDKPIEVLSYQNHMCFYRNGYRADGDKMARRANLGVLALAYLLTKEERYLNRAEDYIWAISDEFSWAIPAHLKESGNSPVPFEKQPYYIELVAATTAATLAEVDALLGDALSDRIRRRIRMEVDRRIFTPFEDRVFSLFWEETAHNWASVCASSLGVCYIHLASRERTVAILPRLKHAIQNFLDGYDTDGCCLEGFSYWNYGFGNFLVFADLLDRYTNGEDNYFKDEKIHRISLFQQRVILPSAHVINYADSSDLASINISATHMLHARYPDVICPKKEEYNLSLLAKASIMKADFPNLLRNYVWTNPDCDGDLMERSYHHYMPKAEWFVEKNSHYAFAAKGGHNGEPYLRSAPNWAELYENRIDRNEPHNHNDIGQFIFYSADECVFRDLGAGLYYGDYFLPEHRYKYLPASSRGHSVPIIDGQEQAKDAYHAAKVLKVTENTFSMDIAGGYDVKGLINVIRTFHIDEAGVTLTDLYCSERKLTVTERFVCACEPILDENTLKVGKGILMFDPDAVSCTLSNQSYKTSNGADDIAYFADFTFECDGEASVAFRME